MSKVRLTPTPSMPPDSVTAPSNPVTVAPPASFAVTVTGKGAFTRCGEVTVSQTKLLTGAVTFNVTGTATAGFV